MPYLMFFILVSYLETITVQAPHPPSAQPNFVPLSPTVDLLQEVIIMEKIIHLRN